MPKVNMTKREAEKQHRQSWIAYCANDTKWRHDYVAFRESWACYTDSLQKSGQITENQYNRWVTPEIPRAYPMTEQEKENASYYM